jgi:hypothetical protein
VKSENPKSDELVKSLKMRYSVISLKTGIQSFQYLGRFWIPACAGMTTFYDFIKIADYKLHFEQWMKGDRICSGDSLKWSSWTSS